MKDPQSLLNHLCAWVECETTFQRELSAILDTQERAVLAGDAAAVAESVEQVQAVLERAPERAERRVQVFTDLGELWQVAVRFLTLSSIAERFGPCADHLVALRSELRTATADVVRRQRRISKFVATHRRVTRDILEALFGAENGGPLECEGTLLNAEA
ncbi:MAG: hypothetical protein GY711_04715 [bacterium]|nr:hypothetical protein [bacterium]